MRVVVCDTDLGNLRSVERALLEASRGIPVTVDVTRDPTHLRAADRLVVPGQGAFRDGMAALGGALGDAVREHLAAARPYLGICLGLQLLFEGSDEAPGCAGLGVLPGRVVRLRGGVDALTGLPLKIPHVGWNTVDVARAGVLPAGPACHFYFVHSYVAVPADGGVVAATTEYGERFASAIERGSLAATQFHPEKSGHAGIALLERFLRR